MEYDSRDFDPDFAAALAGLRFDVAATPAIMRESVAISDVELRGLKEFLDGYEFTISDNLSPLPKAAPTSDDKIIIEGVVDKYIALRMIFSQDAEKPLDDRMPYICLGAFSPHEDDVLSSMRSLRGISCKLVDSSGGILTGQSDPIGGMNFFGARFGETYKLHFSE